MDYSRELLFFFGALGVFNGMLLSIYFLFFARPAQVSNRFLGGLLVMLSIRIGKSVFYYFNQGLSRHYLQFGLLGCFMIGPFLFLYIRSKIYPQTNQDRRWIYIAGIPFVFYLILGTLYSYHSYPHLWWNYFVRGIMYEWLGFILASAFLLRGLFRKIFLARGKLEYSEVFTLSVFLGVFAIWLAYYTSSMTSYIVGSLSFSFVLYTSVAVLIAYRFKKDIHADSPAKYANRKIQDSEARQFLEKVEQLMKADQLFKDPNLTLSKLAGQLNISPHYLSQVLNDNLNKRFTQFVNEYRIGEAKKMLQENKHLKMEVIAEQCGFNSTSAFYTAFKKYTATTPARYMAQIGSLSNS